MERREQSTPLDAAPGKLASRFDVRVSRSAEDPEWDAFVASTPGGRHVQSSLWGRAKAFLGWRSVRVVAFADGAIVGGAQLLLRSLPLGVNIGYVPRGPLLAGDDTDVAQALVATLRKLAHLHRILFVAVRPPETPGAVCSALVSGGFGPASIELDLDPLATTIVDLRPGPDEILSWMASKTRYNIRLSERKGVVVREGGETDLRTFYDLLQSTGERQGFSTYSLDYYANLWQLFGRDGNVKLFLAEYEDEVLSGMLAIPFGDTVTYWRGAWSGRQSKLHPNEAMHWAAINWAKANGYDFYDLEGIDASVGQAIVGGHPVRAETGQSLTTYKLGFGGQVALFPGTHAYVPNQFVRWAYRHVLPNLLTESRLYRLADVVRGIRDTGPYPGVLGWVSRRRSAGGEMCS